MGRKSDYNVIYVTPTETENYYTVTYRATVIATASCPETARHTIDAHKRQRANAARRAREDAMRSIGMVKTKYGWE